MRIFAEITRIGEKRRDEITLAGAQLILFPHHRTAYQFHWKVLLENRIKLEYEANVRHWAKVQR